jgi:BioD-like phosphotransacetylase family protein
LEYGKIRSEGVTRSAKCLLVGSIQTYSGKSSAILGIAHQLQGKGVEVAYGKPIGSYNHEDSDPVEADVRFITKTLNLATTQARSPLLNLHNSTLQKRMQGQDTQDYAVAFQNYVQDLSGDLILLEGSGTLTEGQLFGLSIQQMADLADAAVLLVTRYDSFHFVDDLLAAQKLLGNRLIGVLINGIAPEDQETVDQDVKPFLEQQGIPVLGMLPRDSLLRSVSVRELAKRLNARVLCREDRLDLLVQNLSIGAMNVNSALEYFRKGKNMAVITGGDRSDLQMAALETSTHCLILTGHVVPQEFIINRAEDLEVPILAVNLDTLTTVEIVDQAFGHVRLQEPIQVQCMRDLMANHFDIDRLMGQLGLEPATVS